MSVWESQFRGVGSAYETNVHLSTKAPMPLYSFLYSSIGSWTWWSGRNTMMVPPALKIREWKSQNFLSMLFPLPAGMGYG